MRAITSDDDQISKIFYEIVSKSARLISTEFSISEFIKMYESIGLYHYDDSGNNNNDEPVL